MTREEVVASCERARKRVEERGFAVRPMGDEERERYKTRIEELKRMRDSSATQVAEGV